MSLSNSSFTVAGAPCNSAPCSGAVYGNQAIIGSDTWEILPPKSLVNTGGLPITNRGTPASDHFRLALRNVCQVGACAAYSPLPPDMVSQPSSAQSGRL